MCLAWGWYVKYRIAQGNRPRIFHGQPDTRYYFVVASGGPKNFQGLRYFSMGQVLSQGGNNATGTAVNHP
jgi:hypothetical protein